MSSWASAKSGSISRAFAVLADGLVELPLAGQQPAEVVVGLDEFGVDLQGLVEVGDGLVAPPGAGQGDREVLLGFGKNGVDFQGLAVLGDGLVESALVGQRRCRADCASGRPKAPLGRDAEVLFGHLGLAPVQGQQAEMVVQVPVVGRLGKRRLVGLPGCLDGLRRQRPAVQVVPVAACRGLAEGMVELIGERRPGRHVHHDGGSLVFVAGRQRQQFRTALPRGNFALLAAASCGRAATTWSRTARARR